VSIEAATTFASAHSLDRPTLHEDLRALRRYRALVRYLFSTSLRTENTGTLFGFVWWILDPVLLMVVYLFLFAVVFRGSEPAFPIFILVSLLAWELFLGAARGSMSVTIARERAMRQIAYPRSAIPVALTGAEVAHFVFGLAVAVAVAYLGYGIVPSWEVVALVPLTLIEVAFTLGIAFFLTALNFFYRDVSHLMTYAFRLWFFLSPGVYSISRVPSTYRHVYQLNPFSTIFRGFHGAILHQPMPGALALAYTSCVSVLTLVFGYRYFVRRAPRFAKLA
jgi:ABC-type polysaccharide/polyol phosphate export permease